MNQSVVLRDFTVIASPESQGIEITGCPNLTIRNVTVVHTRRSPS